jgi:hypothetical protein
VGNRQLDGRVIGDPFLRNVRVAKALATRITNFFKVTTTIGTAAVISTDVIIVAGVWRGAIVFLLAHRSTDFHTFVRLANLA